MLIWNTLQKAEAFKMRQATRAADAVDRCPLWAKILIVSITALVYLFGYGFVGFGLALFWLKPAQAIWWGFAVVVVTAVIHVVTFIVKFVQEIRRRENGID